MQHGNGSLFWMRTAKGCMTLVIIIITNGQNHSLVGHVGTSILTYFYSWYYWILSASEFTRVPIEPFCGGFWYAAAVLQHVLKISSVDRWHGRLHLRAQFRWLQLLHYRRLSSLPAQERSTAPARPSAIGTGSQELLAELMKPVNMTKYHAKSILKTIGFWQLH